MLRDDFAIGFVEIATETLKNTFLNQTRQQLPLVSLQVV